jgi:cell division protease FtsH
VTIIPRGRALGITQQLPIDEKHTYPRDYLLNNIAIMMGGRVAEELVLNSQTTGAGNDIERSTEIARKMVCEWGMSDKLGPLTFGKKEEQIFLGREFAQHRDYSEETAHLIDNEIRDIVTKGYERAKEIIKTNIAILNKLANTLLEKEVLDGNQIEAIIKGETV